MKQILFPVAVLLASSIFLSSADGCVDNDKVAKPVPLHHIIEFGKRSKVERKGCKNSSNPKDSDSILGLHGLLHTRSQHKNKQNATEVKGKNYLSKNVTFEKPKTEPGFRRSSTELHKLQLRTETINMLHKIVEKYFPGGHLTVDQKIKALKILGKLIKLKKSGKNSDIKKLLGSLSTHNPSETSSSTPGVSKVKVNPAQNEESGKKDNTDQSGGDDIYANIASGPDVPKLPPSLSGKDPDHAHSNIMPVGLKPLGGRGGAVGEMMNAMTRPNDISDNLNERVSNYQAPLSNSQMNMGQIYQNGNSFPENTMGISNMPNILDSQAYARNQMSYPRRSNGGRYWKSSRRGYYGYDDDDDDNEYDDDGDEENDREDEEQGRARSYVNRRHYYADDEDDESDEDDNDGGDEIVYTRRFDRKDKIAKLPKITKIKPSKRFKVSRTEN